MVELHLSTADSSFLRRIRISVADDLRTRSQTESRFAIPEWLRRTIWRQFWAANDEMEDGATSQHACAVVQGQYPDRERSISLKQESRAFDENANLLDEGLRFGTDARTEYRRTQEGSSLGFSIVSLLLILCCIGGYLWWLVAQ